MRNYFDELTEKLGIVVELHGIQYQAFCEKLPPGSPIGHGIWKDDAIKDLLARLFSSHITILKQVRELLGKEGFEENVQKVFILDNRQT